MNYAFDFSKYNNIAVFPHSSPDGDAIGSAVAMSMYLREIGKKSIIVIDDEIQYELRFLLDYTDFIGYDEAKKLCNDWDLCVTVDCGDLDRIARRKDLVEGKPLLNIDHHVTNPNFGDFNIVEGDAPSACEIIYFILKENAFDITKEIGEAIYTGMSTDTGNFMYENVRVQTFEVAAKLLSIGIDKAKIIYNLYQNNRAEKIKIHALAMDKITFHCDKKLAITHVDEKMFEETGASVLDTEGISESLRDIEGVEVSCFIKEKTLEDGTLQCKVSMRAMIGHDLSKIASDFGGGGHKAAAGFTIDEGKDRVKELLLEKFDI